MTTQQNRLAAALLAVTEAVERQRRVRLMMIALTRMIHRVRHSLNHDGRHICRRLESQPAELGLRARRLAVKLSIIHGART